MTSTPVLSGLRVAVSRRPFPDMKREQVVQMLRDLGAQVAKEVTNETDFLLCDEKSLNEASTPKIRTALAKNVPVLLPSEFEKLKAGTPLAQLGYRNNANPSPSPVSSTSNPRLEDRLPDLVPSPDTGAYQALF